MELKDIVANAGVDVTSAVVMFHAIPNVRLMKALPMLASEEPELFDAVQDQHASRAEATLSRHRFMLSFVNISRQDYRFAGLFEVLGFDFQTNSQMDADPRRRILCERYGEQTQAEMAKSDGREGRKIFDLALSTNMRDFIGRLVVNKPRDRNYLRILSNLNCPVVEITRESQLLPPPPSWDGFIVSASEVKKLPSAHEARLREWRGIYQIVDRSDGARYVGSAYGEENLLGRWRQHVASAKGVTVELRERSPDNFQFSILELLAPTAGVDEVVQKENSWKERLATREFGLNRN